MDVLQCWGTQNAGLENAQAAIGGEHGRCIANRDRWGFSLGDSQPIYNQQKECGLASSLDKLRLLVSVASESASEGATIEAPRLTCCVCLFQADVSRAIGKLKLRETSM